MAVGSSAGVSGPQAPLHTVRSVPIQPSTASGVGRDSDFDPIVDRVVETEFGVPVAGVALGSQVPPQRPTFAFVAAPKPPPPLGFNLDDLPEPFVEKGAISVRISEAPFLRGLERCKSNLVAKVILPNKADAIKTHDLAAQLRVRWSQLKD